MMKFTRNNTIKRGFYRMAIINNDTELKAVMLKKISDALFEAASEIQNQLWTKVFSEDMVKVKLHLRKNQQFFKSIIKARS